MNGHGQNKLPQVVTPTQGESTLSSDRVQAPVAQGSSTDSGGCRTCHTTNSDGQKTNEKKTVTGQTKQQFGAGRARLNSAPSVAAFVSYRTATDKGQPTDAITKPEQTDLRIIDELRNQLTRILERVRMMQEKTGIQKNVNKETKDGIKIVLEAAEVALSNCGKLRNLRTVRHNEKTSTDQNSKRKRDTASISPPQQAAKKPTVTENVQRTDTLQREGGWQTQTNKKKRKQGNQQTDTAKRTNENKELQKRDRQRPAPRGTAVLVKPQQGKTYADLVRQMKSKVDPATDNVTVRGYRKTKDGGLLLQLQTGPEESQSFQRSLQSAIGQEGCVRALIPSTSLEIMDLDCIATAEEVAAALEQETGQKGDTKVHVFGPNRTGQCMAVCQLDAHKAKALLDKGRIKIGWVNCRVRLRTTVTRCYRCLGYGHTRRDCKGPDRTNSCWKCGHTGHAGKTCNDRLTCFLCVEAERPEAAHKPGTGLCAVFREALEEAKKRTKT